MAERRERPLFMFLRQRSGKSTSRKAVVDIDRDKAAALGLTMNDVGSAMSAMLGGGYVNYFNLGGRSYKVIRRWSSHRASNTEQLSQYYVRAGNGTPGQWRRWQKSAQKQLPESLNHFQELNSATIQGGRIAGRCRSDALAYLQNLAARTLPEGYSVDYGGEFRQIVQELARRTTPRRLA